MKVVAQSKLIPAQEKARAVKPFFSSLDALFSPIVQKILDNPDAEVCALLIYTDRGLCGPCNNGITRMLEKENLGSTEIVLWGEKGSAAFQNSKLNKRVVFSAHPNMKTALSFTEITSVVQKLIERECDIFRIVHNRMEGANSSAINEIYVPALRSLDQPGVRDLLNLYELEATNPDEILQNLNEYHLSSVINYACVENQAVELFQRRNSMQSASTNAKEVAQKIGLKYNKARQGLITTELGEIVSGAAAVDEMIKK